MNRLSRFCLCLVWCGAITSGCSMQGLDGVKPLVKESPETETTTKLLGPSIPLDFNLNGSIGLLQAEQNGWHGKLSWQQRQSDFSIQILGPFGDTQAELVSQAGVLKLKAPDGQYVSGNKLIQWQKHSFGATVPFQALPYWLHGVPYPDMEEAKIKKAKDQISQLQQDGWQVNYSEWSKLSGHTMPTRITITKANMRIKLVINDYTRS